ncbi:MAG TPA: hypothetical protein EYP73_05905 [Acidimicrobiia bacterium]|nr:hypothetical protein [Acidimicrobiia bacterium]
MDRDAFLARVGQAAMKAVLPESPESSSDLPTLEGGEDLVALFRRRAQEVDAVVHGPVSRSGAPRAVAGIAAGHHVATFMAWDHLPAPGVVSAMGDAGLERVDHRVPRENRRDH